MCMCMCISLWPLDIDSTEIVCRIEMNVWQGKKREESGFVRFLYKVERDDVKGVKMGEW